MENQDILKSFATKLIDYIFYCKKSTLKHADSIDSLFQMRIPIFSHVHSEIDYMWEDRSKEIKEFSVEIFQIIDNCDPLLLER